MQEVFNVIGKLDDRSLAFAELKNDLLFHKIPKEKVSYYVDGSLFIGRSKAAQYIGRDLKTICRENGVNVEIVNKSGKFYGVRFRAEISFSKKENRIKIYKESLIELMNTCNKADLFNFKLTYKDVFNIHLAHEFYHYLEYKEKQHTNELLGPITTMNFGFFKNKATITKCSEIAAHSFCKEVLGLKYLPNIYDYLYLIELGQITFTDFKEMVFSWKKTMEN